MASLKVKDGVNLEVHGAQVLVTKVGVLGGFGEGGRRIESFQGVHVPLVPPWFHCLCKLLYLS